MATIYEVSKLAGVSLATVSRVINNTVPVRESTRLKVEAAMRELGFRPSSVAQSLATSRSNSIGIVVSELGGPFYGELLSRIEEEFRAIGKHVIIAAGHSDAELERDSIEFLRSRNCDAVILHVESIADEYLIKLAAEGLPFVIINRLIPTLKDRCITLDNQHGGYLATEHLIASGHKKIGYISGPLWKQDAKDRYEGHKSALASAGITENPAFFYEGDFHEAGGELGFHHILAQQEKVTAIVCANDEMASGAITAAHEAGLLIPDNLAIIGFDNINFAHYTHPKLTTIDYPIAEIGHMAAHWVLKHVYNRPIPELQQIFSPTLIVRDSA